MVKAFVMSDDTVPSKSVHHERFAGSVAALVSVVRVGVRIWSLCEGIKQRCGY